MMYLTENKRSNDKVFSDYLLEVGSNMVPGSIRDPLLPHRPEVKQIPIPEHMASKSATLDEFLQEMFPNVNEYDHEKPVSILTPRNDDMRLINDKCLNNFSSTRFNPSFSSDSAHIQNSTKELNIPIETLHSWNPSGFPPHDLRFKEHAPYICLKNLNLSAGLCNGTRLELLEKSRYLLKVRNLHTNQIAFIPRILNIDQDTFGGIEFRRRQFPVQLSYAMSINKVQVYFVFLWFFLFSFRFFFLDYFTA